MFPTSTPDSDSHQGDKEEQERLLALAHTIQNLYVGIATGGSVENQHYEATRKRVLAEPMFADELPWFVKQHRILGQFWSFIKAKFSTYEERRQYLWTEFEPLFKVLEQGNLPIEQVASYVLQQLDSDHLAALWQKAHRRCRGDPQGAITAARSLLESTCKLILDECGIEYQKSWDLQRLYKTAGRQLNLSPDQHGEEVFKKILGGCSSIIDGVASVRNHLGDAHGSGKHPVRPSARHANLVVNLSGTMATFLIETWLERREKNPM